MSQRPWWPIAKLAHEFGFLTKILVVDLVMIGVLLGCGSGGGSTSSAGAPPPLVGVSIVTHHYDNARTGWNNNETSLNPSNVSGSSFGLLHTVVLDDQVDGQPLVVAGLSSVGGKSINGHDVAYVASENNTLYAIDATTGAILVSRNLGQPVPRPLGCASNGDYVGITSTPVIDKSSNTIYLIAYTLENGFPTYRVHAIDITNLSDRAQIVVTASHSLPSGSAVSFDASAQRQRAALLADNGNIYAGFASFCGYAADRSRGWILGWKQGTLSPLPANSLTDIQETGGYYLASIWMAGSGLASNNGNIVAVTGNSNPNGAAYDAAGGTNYSESVIELTSDLTKIVDWFTPPNVVDLEAADFDFGSGGILVLPGSTQLGGVTTRLATAAGKDGIMFLLNADQLGHGGRSPAMPAPLATPRIGPCWCAESYFVGQYGPTIVTSAGGNGQSPTSPRPHTPETVQLWSIQTGIASGTNPLTNVAGSEDISGTPQDAGFFTSISSEGSTNAIIWAITRPESAAEANGNHLMYLYAFSEALTNGQLTRLYKGPAGEWGPASMYADSNAVPVVANGHVFIASYKQLQIFGLH